jgi:hypothetical protein
MRKLILTTSGAILAFVLGAGSASAAGLGPPHRGFYVDGTVYNTIGTKTDFSGTGAPLHSFDAIYDLGGGSLLNVAEAKPGDRDFNGGRWMVLPISWNIAPVQYTSEEEILDAEQLGDIEIGDPIKFFECPVIRAN